MYLSSHRTQLCLLSCHVNVQRTSSVVPLHQSAQNGNYSVIIGLNTTNLPLLSFLVFGTVAFVNCVTFIFPGQITSAAYHATSFARVQPPLNHNNDRYVYIVRHTVKDTIQSSLFRQRHEPQHMIRVQTNSTLITQNCPFPSKHLAKHLIVLAVGRSYSRR